MRKSQLIQLIIFHLIIPDPSNESACRKKNYRVDNTHYKKNIILQSIHRFCQKKYRN